LVGPLQQRYYRELLDHVHAPVVSDSIVFVDRMNWVYALTV